MQNYLNDTTNSNSTSHIIFDGKTLGDLLKEIYINSTSKKEMIDRFIETLEKAIEANPKSIGYLTPFIKDFVEVSVTNDDQLVKIATIASRMISKIPTSEESGLLTEQDKKELLEIYERSQQK